MKTCIFFAGDPGPEADGLPLVPGYGFRPDGAWRPLPLPAEAEGLILDDRFLPDRRGLEQAAAALAAWDGLLVLDFERPPAPLTEALLRRLEGKQTVVPSAWAELPRSAVLAGPWRGGGSFLRWLAALKVRYGSLVLDAAPLRHRVLPGSPPIPWEGPLPEAGFPCPGAGCLHRRTEDGALLFWDTKETLTARCRAAGVPCIVFGSDWRALSPPPPPPEGRESGRAG